MKAIKIDNLNLEDLTVNLIINFFLNLRVSVICREYLDFTVTKAELSGRWDVIRKGELIFQYDNYTDTYYGKNDKGPQGDDSEPMFTEEYIREMLANYYFGSMHALVYEQRMSHD